MALTNVQYSKVDGRYQSDPIEVTGQNIGVQISMKHNGDAMLQTSLDGIDYVDNTFLKVDNNNTILGIITGAVVGMFIKIQFYGIAEPSKIQIIQS